MNRAAIALLMLAAGAIAGGGAGYWFAARGHAPAPAARPAPSPDAAKSERRVLYWYDPMSPQQRFDKPGKSPFMDMQLVPKYADEGGSETGVRVSPDVAHNLGVRTAEAKRASLAPRFSAVGSVEYNERAFVVVQPRANGYIERLYVRAALDPVRQGDPLVELLLPDWAAAQEEYLVLRTRGGSADLTAAARQRLVLLGMTDELIAAIERSGVAQPRITLRAPVSGVIAELGARQGMTVNAGATLFRIASLGSIWVVAEVPEAQASVLTLGARVRIHASAYPNEQLAGRVSAILPEVNAATRTVRARIEVANPGGRLKPGMYANIDFAPVAREVLVVPGEAVIRTGTRDVVIVAAGEGRFRPVEVQVGTETAEGTEIRSGLKAGERVVVSSQFLIDSEASLRSALDRLQSAPAEPQTSAAATHRGTGSVTGIDPAKGRVELQHGPIPTLKWPAMTMDFPVADKSALVKLSKGDTVEFELRGEPNADGEYVIVRLTPPRARK